MTAISVLYERKKGQMAKKCAGNIENFATDILEFICIIFITVSIMKHRCIFALRVLHKTEE